jgi:hypothetical protein
MKLYAIHAPLGVETVAAAEGARAARTGFSLAAFVFGPLWLLARGLWRPLLVYVVAAAAVIALGAFGWLRPGAVFWLIALGHLYVAFEGRGWVAEKRERAGRPTVDLIYAHNALEAERRYLDRVLQPSAAFPRRGLPTGGPDVIGLFPEPGR